LAGSSPARSVAGLPAAGDDQNLAGEKEIEPVAKKKKSKGQLCSTVGDLLKCLKGMDRDARICMADDMDIYVVPHDGTIVFTDLDDDGNPMDAEESDAE
jgi:hypothetical protein